MKECQSVGEPCTGQYECCSGLCADNGIGVSVCQFASGCRPIGEVCLENDDCCSELCEDYENTGIKRCGKPGGCLATGEICWLGMAANCCPSGPTGGQQLCQDTILGITRCFSPDDTTCLDDGSSCSFSDQCCGGFCLPDPTTGELVCAADCVDTGQPCTADLDCCDGVCWDGVCNPSSMGCDPLGSSCTEDDDCCSGYCDPTDGTCLPAP